MHDASSKSLRGQKDASRGQNPPRGPNPPAKVTADAKPSSSRLSPYLRHWPAALGVLSLLAIGAGGYAYWRYVTLYPSTDNAYVQANVVQITPVVSGVVSEVNVTGFSKVKSGDVLVRIDQPRFEAALKAAQARLALVQQQAKTPAAQQAVQASLIEAQGAVDRAQAELDQATIKAPVDGTVGKVLIRPGTIAKAGVGLFPIIDTSKWWVDANFKETDLARIHPGQKATVYVDLFPSHELTGEVEAISPVSTSALSLLPPENATGSWIKLTQRFPVRISLTLKPDDPAMRLGASAAVTVDTTDKGADSAAR
jgi:membrane fusion protein (multidrug efflux system)